LGLFFHFLEQRQITDIQSVTPGTLGRLPTLDLLPADQAGDAQGRGQPNGILAAVKSLCRFLKVEG